MDWDCKIEEGWRQLMREPLSSGFSTEENLISASSVSPLGYTKTTTKMHTHTQKKKTTTIHSVWGGGGIINLLEHRSLFTEVCTLLSPLLHLSTVIHLVSQQSGIDRYSWMHQLPLYDLYKMSTISAAAMKQL